MEHQDTGCARRGLPRRVHAKRLPTRIDRLELAHMLLHARAVGRNCTRPAVGCPRLPTSPRSRAAADAAPPWVTNCTGRRPPPAANVSPMEERGSSPSSTGTWPARFGRTSRSGSGVRSRPRRRSRSCVDDPAFLADPGRHPAMFADHGVVHVRDVAIGLVRLLDTINGVLLARRDRRAAPRSCSARGRAGLPPRHRHGRHDARPAAASMRCARRTRRSGRTSTRSSEHLLADRARSRSGWTRSTPSAPFAAPLELVVREMLSHERRPQQVSDPGGRARRPRASSGACSSGSCSRASTPIAAASWVPRGRRRSPIPSTANTAAYADPSTSFAWLARAGRAAGRARRRRRRRAAGAARGRRAPPARDGPADVGRVRAVHGRRDGACRVHAAARDRRRGLRDHLRRRARRRRGQHPGRVRDAAGPPPHRVPPWRVRQPTRPRERAAASEADVIVDIAGGRHPVVRRQRRSAAGFPRRARSIDDVRIQLERPDDRPAFADEVAARGGARRPDARARGS